MQQYLQVCEFIDWDHPHIQAQARELADGCRTPEQIAGHCFAFVRDRIRHSWDARLNPVTCKASEVLRHGTGFCYAKSHLLAALCRANGIPAGLCYQRLSIDGKAAPFCLHGLNAVWLPSCGWYRVDARGDKPGVQTGFTPPEERLAFPISMAGEADLPEIWPRPLACVTDILTQARDVEAVADCLPDVDLWMQASQPLRANAAGNTCVS